MFFSITICDEALYQEARWYFLQQWRSDLLSREPSSLIWAYIVTQEMFKLWKTWFSLFILENSFNHSRDESLLQNVHVPNSPFSPRENFYLQWCAKECLVKYLNLTSSEMEEMVVKSFLPNHYFSVEWWEFNSLIILQHRWKETPVHVRIKDGVVLAFLHQDNYNYMNN